MRPKDIIKYFFYKRVWSCFILWLDTHAPDIGDRNLGRIAIGDITVKAWY